MSRTRTLASLCAAVVVGLFALGCGPVGNNEAALLLNIQASEAFRASGMQPVAIRVSVTAPGGAASDTFMDIGGWPNDPTTHTVLVLASDMMGANSLDVPVGVTACGDASCTVALASGSGTPTLVAGDDVEFTITVD